MTTFMQKRFLRGPKPFRATLLLLLLGLLLAAFLAAPASSDASIAWLNKHRVANGIPPVAEVPLPEPCHDSAYNAEGKHYPYNWSRDNFWSDYTSPWSGPLHEFQIYNPMYSTAGYGEAPNGAACLSVGDVVAQPKQPTFYQFLAPAGPNMVSPLSFVYAEGPFAPQETVGIPQGVVIGPQLILYAMGFPGQDRWKTAPIPVEATLKASDGSSVPIVMATAETVAAYGYPGYLPNGAVMIVRNELPYETAFHARVVWEGGGVQAVQEFSFTTRPNDEEEPNGGGNKAKARRSPKLRARFQVRGKNMIVGRIRFAKGAKGGLRVVAACGKPRTRKTLRVTKRWANGAIVKGRVKPCAGKLRVKTRIVASGEFKAGQARVQTLRVG